MRLGLLFLSLSTLAFSATDFSRDVEPLLKKRCAGCHGAANAMNGLRLDSGEGVLKGGYSGPAVVAGKSADSRLIERVTAADKAKRMPPGPNPLQGLLFRKYRNG